MEKKDRRSRKLDIGVNYDNVIAPWLNFILGNFNNKIK